jgi:hypothetical protein
MENQFTELIEKLIKSSSCEESEALSKDICNSLQSREAQSSFIEAVKSIDQELPEDIFHGNRFAALLVFQTLSNAVIKNTEAADFFVQAIKGGNSAPEKFL